MNHVGEHRPFTVIKDTAEVYGWRVDYLDFGIGHDCHVFTNGLANASTTTAPHLIRQ